ncbi:uncharacterized protein TNCV_1958781 [Trichonephila clavipes]|nr:uncharacterized protein TNCV_1958781 [Trichonephila clavipes]
MHSQHSVPVLGPPLCRLFSSNNGYYSAAISSIKDSNSLRTEVIILTWCNGTPCRCKAKSRLRRSPRGLYALTRLSSLLTLNLDSSLKTTWFHSAAVKFPRARHHSKRRSRWVGVKCSKSNGSRDSKCTSIRRLCMIREDTGVPNEGATCAWTAADESVGCTRAFLTMWRSCRGLVYRGWPEPGLRVNDIFWIHWSQHFLTT